MNRQRKTVRQQAEQAFEDSLDQLHDTFDADDEGNFLEEVPPNSNPNPEDLLPLPELEQPPAQTVTVASRT